MLKKTISKDNCCGCSACYNVCPKHCIEMKGDEEGFLYPEINKSICVECGRCESVCGFNKRKGSKIDLPSYGARNIDDEVREKSSSGGIFSLIALEVLNAGGVVCGVELSEDCKSARHIKIDNASQLDRLRGSKYLQSDVGDMYSQVEIELKKGKKVLFSGTPCQISGLYSYLNNYFDNLLTIEVVCHGVPSPLLWEKYVCYLEKKRGQRIVRAYFRDKIKGWKQFGMKNVFADGKVTNSDLNKNIYLQLFLKNYSLRQSCFNCHMKCIGDIILGDYWGIEYLKPEVDDDRGLSMILLNSEKGEKIFKKIKNSMICFDACIEDALPYNISLISSVEKNINRDIFFHDLQNMSFEKVIRKYRAKIHRKELEKNIRIVKYYFKRGILLSLKIFGVRKKRR